MKYRDYLVSTIKASGEELMKRAETLIAYDLEKICDVEIVISIKPNAFPAMHITTSVINEKAVREFARYSAEKNNMLDTERR